MKGRDISKVALITGADGFGRSGREQTLAVAKEMDIEIVADVTYSPSDTGYDCAINSYS